MAESECESSTVPAGQTNDAPISKPLPTNVKAEPPNIVTGSKEEPVNETKQSEGQKAQKDLPQQSTPKHANKRESRMGHVQTRQPFSHMTAQRAQYSPSEYGRYPTRQQVSPGNEYRYYSREWQDYPYHPGQPSYRYDQRNYPPQQQPYPPHGYPYQRADYEGNNFSRAVSSSFDRSGPNNKKSPRDDNGPVSWGRELNPIEERARRNIRVNAEPGSTSSSLTNSPVGKSKETDSGDRPLPTPSKLAALDSLSSVASGQEPMTDPKKDGPPSPGSSTASLDLMKCHSGSSGLLHGFSDKAILGSSFDKLETKRSREEERGEQDQKEDGHEKRTTEDQQPPTKKKKEESKKKKSPLGIDCSPSNSPTKRPSSSLQARYDATSSPGFYDNAPSYTYSLDSATNPRNYQSLYRPGSSASSTIPPMDRHVVDAQPEGVGPSLPSWEIPHSDSFGNGSTSGVMASFSFTNDYLTLPSGGSNLERREPPQSRYPAAESRNQSFDHYHCADPRGPPPPPPPSRYGKYEKHHGAYPPHAPSWGTTYSSGSHHAPPPYRGPTPYGYPRNGGPHSPRHQWVNRNYSEESAVRASPPPGPPRQLIPASRAPPPNSFEPPPPAFAAPHANLQRRPPPAVYIMSSPANSSQQPGHAAKVRMGKGVYSWTKEDDMRLAEVMKKYKNPRDWEPIAKEMGRGKSSKECHERWIRYLKPGVRKGQWQDHEDAIVVEAVTNSKEQPFTRWSDLAQRLPGRVGKQIRDRW